MKTLLLILMLLSFPLNGGKLWKYLFQASKEYIDYDFDNDIQSVKHGDRLFSKKRIKEMSKILVEQGFSICPQNDTILIFLHFNPEFVGYPETIDAFSLSCELHLRLKRDNNCYVTNAPDSLICFSPGERLYEEFDLLVEKKVQQYIRANDVSSFLKLYQMFTGITIPPSPEDAFRIIIHEGRVYDSSHWEYSIAPVRMIIAGETIKPEDTVDRIIEEKKKALLMI